MNEVNILIQSLQRGESRLVARDDNSYMEQLPPTRVALQAARALQQLAQRVDLDQQTIARLQHEANLLNNENIVLRERKQNETKATSDTASNSSDVGAGSNSTGCTV